jgi:ABC-type lipoprotein release transport system permease subunit
VVAGWVVTVRGPDLMIIAPVAALIGLLAMAACLIPARRAAAADPASTLRAE